MLIYEFIISKIIESLATITWRINIEKILCATEQDAKIMNSQEELSWWKLWLISDREKILNFKFVYQKQGIKIDPCLNI